MHSKDELFWDKPNKNNSYWAGFIAADGCIRKQEKRQAVLAIKLNSKDKELLENFKTCVRYSGDISVGQYKQYKHISINICSCDKWVNDLKDNFNITAKKSMTLEPPNIEDQNLKLQFLVGLIDGDGCICLSKNMLHFELCGTPEMLTWASLLINEIEEGYTPMNIKTRTRTKCCSIGCKSNRAEKLLKILKNVPTPYKLSRKWDIIK